MVQHSAVVRVGAQLFLSVLVVCAADAQSPAAFHKGIAAAGAKLTLLANSFKFTEGPATDKQGNVLFTDQPNNRILEWSVDGKLSTFMSDSGRSNGMYFDRSGDLYACADLNNQLWEIDPATKKVTVLVKDYDGKKLNGPNDVWVRPDGGIYITDPFYKRDYWTRGGMEQPGQYVYYLTPDHEKLTPVIQDMKQPNGIVGSPDGKRLYVADIGGNKTYSYSINQDGTLSDKTLFVDMGSDGMTIDDKGDLYLTGKGVTVFNANGEEIDYIPIDKPWTGNIKFGGKDRDTLFITASDSLYSLRTRVHGTR
ncbi:MAG TPA: SMP-30/gluconolactonase/LRE family protein [Bryobacteraceae bacterium]|jgi:gluconolactonase|nr:SMP-30/gluconolactonase/LRE family protein [Bryobacteraceae bacterium]